MSKPDEWFEDYLFADDKVDTLDEPPNILRQYYKAGFFKAIMEVLKLCDKSSDFCGEEIVLDFAVRNDIEKLGEE